MCLSQASPWIRHGIGENPQRKSAEAPMVIHESASAASRLLGASASGARERVSVGVRKLQSPAAGATLKLNIIPGAIAGVLVAYALGAGIGLLLARSNRR
jgi:hypothetical protein